MSRTGGLNGLRLPDGGKTHAGRFANETRILTKACLIKLRKIAAKHHSPIHISRFKVGGTSMRKIATARDGAGRRSALW
jgi:hypothetical protein